MLYCTNKSVCQCHSLSPWPNIFGKVNISSKYQTRVEKTDSDKHSSLLRYGIDYNCKKFCGTSPCGLYHKCFTIVIYDRKGTLQFSAFIIIVIYTSSFGSVSQECSFIVQASVITIVNYDCKSFIVQTPEGSSFPCPQQNLDSVQKFLFRSSG